MDHRSAALSTALLLASAISALAGTTGGCKGPDPGAITFSERAGIQGEPQGEQAGTSSGTTPAPVADGGGGGGTPDPVFGLTPFAWVDPGVQANNANAAHAGTVEGKDCSTATTCHGAGGPQIWLMGGTVYSAATGGQIVPKAEVKIVDGAGNEVAKAYTDNNGNFWMPAEGKTIPAGSKVGVRKEGGARPMAMATPVGAGDSGCYKAGCHVATPVPGAVYIP